MISKINQMNKPKNTGTGNKGDLVNTQRKRREPLTRSSELRYQRLFENMSEGFALCKMIFEGGKPVDFIYVDVNDKFSELTGLRDVVGKRVTVAIPGIRESDPLLFEMYGRVVKTGIPEKSEFFVEALKMWFSLSVYRPAKEHFVAVFDVITERKLIEENLRISQKKYQALVEKSPDAILVNRDGLIDFVNPAAITLFGAGNANELIGKDLFGLLHPDSHVIVNDRIKLLKRGKSVPLAEEKIIRFDGTPRYVESSAELLSDEPGTVIQIIMRDITERKLAEIILTEERDRFSKIAATVPGLILSFRKPPEDPFCIPYASPKIEDVFGLSLDELIYDASPMMSRIHPDDLAHVMDSSLESAKTMSAWHDIYRYNHPVKGEIWIEGRSVPVAETDGSIIWHGFVYDVTAAKKTEEALRESEERFRGLYDNATIGLYRTTPDGHILMVNPAGLKMLGFNSMEDMNRRNLEDDGYLPGYSRSGFIEKMKRDGFIKGVESGWTRKDGTYIYVRESAIAIRDAGGNILCYDGTFEDITGQRLLQDRETATLDLLKICNKAGTFQDLMKQLITFFKAFTGCDAVGVRLQKDEDFPYFEVSGFPEEFVRLENHLCSYDLNGYIIRDATGNPALDCMCGNVLCDRFDPAKTFFTERGSFWSGDTTRLLLTTTDADRQAKTRNRCNGEGYESVVLIPMKTGEKIFGLFQFNDKRKNHFTIEKVTILEQFVEYVAIAMAKMLADEEIRALNENLEKRVLERTRMLEVANKELEAFTYSVSHDLRAPLRAISGFTRILVEDCAANLDEEGKSVAAVIRNNTHKMGKLIDDLLAFSRLGRTEMFHSGVDMEDLVAECLSDLNTSKPASLIITISKPLPVIRADRAMMKQVWLNLLSNAIKFSSQEDIPEIFVSCTMDPGQVVFAIRDNGVGFDMQYKDKLFGVFQRLHSQKDFEGTGVGLAIVRRIIDMHGGNVWAESAPGKGATFYFSLNTQQL